MEERLVAPGFTKTNVRTYENDQQKAAAPPGSGCIPSPNWPLASEAPGQRRSVSFRIPTWKAVISVSCKAGPSWRSSLTIAGSNGFNRCVPMLKKSFQHRRLSTLRQRPLALCSSSKIFIEKRCTKSPSIS